MKKSRRNQYEIEMEGQAKLNIFCIKSLSLFRLRLGESWLRNKLTKKNYGRSNSSRIYSVAAYALLNTDKKIRHCQKQQQLIEKQQQQLMQGSSILQTCSISSKLPIMEGSSSMRLGIRQTQPSYLASNLKSICNHKEINMKSIWSQYEINMESILN